MNDIDLKEFVFCKRGFVFMKIIANNYDEALDYGKTRYCPLSKNLKYLENSIDSYFDLYRRFVYNLLPEQEAKDQWEQYIELQTFERKRYERYRYERYGPVYNVNSGKTDTEESPF